mgnify:CR=1 FL=1
MQIARTMLVQLHLVLPAGLQQHIHQFARGTHAAWDLGHKMRSSFGFVMGVGRCAGKSRVMQQGQIRPIVAHGCGLAPVQPQGGQQFFRSG